MSEFVYAVFSTWVTPTVQVQRGEIWDASDPVVKSHPDWFTSDPSAFVRRSDMQMVSANSSSASAPVETTSAAPGEKRVIKRG